MENETHESVRTALEGDGPSVLSGWLILPKSKWCEPTVARISEIVSIYKNVELAGASTIVQLGEGKNGSVHIPTNHSYESVVDAVLFWEMSN